AFHDALGHDSEILAALLLAAAIPASLLGRVVPQRVTMRADRAIGPPGLFEPSPGGFLIVEVGFFELVFAGRHWGKLHQWPNTTPMGLWCQLRIWEHSPGYSRV